MPPPPPPQIFKTIKPQGIRFRQFSDIIGILVRKKANGPKECKTVVIDQDELFALWTLILSHREEIY